VEDPARNRQQTCGMNAADVPSFLKEKVGLFRDFSDERLAELADGGRIVSVEASEAIAHCGDDARFLGVVLEGELVASAPGEGGRPEELLRFKAGDTFGELGLMTGDKVQADLVAATLAQVLEIPVAHFQAAILSEPAAVQRISKTVTERLKQVMADPAKSAAALNRSADPYGLRLQSDPPQQLLVINCGSSSVKYSFFDTLSDASHARGLIERIGTNGTRHVHRGPNGETTRELPTGGYAEAFDALLSTLTDPQSGVIRTPEEVSAVGHRVVHGGERFTEATVITGDVLAHLEELIPLAPLHNPVNLAGIREARRVFPNAPHVAVFDTAFHHTLPAYAYLYGLPHAYAETKGVRRYGFHGLSHAYVGLAAAQFLKRRAHGLRVISCHLGNGASVCAADHGRSVDTSMGFTPAEGLIMGTRCGDLDPGVVTFLQRSEGLSAAQVDELLNKKSGLLGLSGLSSDMREILKAADEGDARALLALKAYCYRIRKYIGAYIAAMGGVDAVIFTGGVGQGSAVVRALAIQGLQCMGLHLDEDRNRNARGFDEISAITRDDSPVTAVVVPTDEERMIARESLSAVSRAGLDHALATQPPPPIPMEVSAHHAHLTQEHVEALFGAGHYLTRRSDLSQPGQYACEEQITLVGPKGRIERVRVLGPARNYTQIEIAMTEQFKLGIHPPVRESGDIDDTPGCTVEGTAGRVTIDRGVICALRHIHMTPADALRFGVRDKSFVRVRVEGDRELIFGDVLVRVDPNFALAMHIDTDEANAANLRTGAQGHIDGIQSDPEDL
jgi:acetate kinase